MRHTTLQVGKHPFITPVLPWWAGALVPNELEGARGRALTQGGGPQIPQACSWLRHSSRLGPPPAPAPPILPVTLPRTPLLPRPPGGSRQWGALALADGASAGPPGSRNRRASRTLATPDSPDDESGSESPASRISQPLHPLPRGLLEKTCEQSLSLSLSRPPLPCRALRESLAPPG